MADVLTSLKTSFERIPVKQRITLAIGAAVVASVAATLLWFTAQPDYTVLYGDLDPAEVGDVTDELDAAGVDYRLEGGGRQVLVPASDLYAVRADLAAGGMAGPASPQGWEILDDQGLTVTDFRQQVDYQRALEGELARTIQGYDAVNSATVHLALPDDSWYADDRTPASASVLLETAGPLDHSVVDGIGMLVASAVDGLDPADVTITDAGGEVLHSPGATAGGAGPDRQLRETREFEAQLAAEVQGLLSRTFGQGTANVVVRAELDFDVSETESETFGDSTVEREQLSDEEFEGTGGLPGGILGIDGGPIPGVTPGGGIPTDDAAGDEDDEDADEAEGQAPASRYESGEEIREYAIDRTVERTQATPGSVARLSVAVAVDDDPEDGGPDPEAVEQLVAAAVGVDPERGDVVEVSPVAFAAEEEPEAEEEEPSFVDTWLTQIIAFLVLLAAVGVAAAIALRGSKREASAVEQLATADEDDEPDIGFDEPEEDADAKASRALREYSADAVNNDPEEVAALIRGWLSDKRSSSGGKS